MASWKSVEIPDDGKVWSNEDGGLDVDEESAGEVVGAGLEPEFTQELGCGPESSGGSASSGANSVRQWTGSDGRWLQRSWMSHIPIGISSHHCSHGSRSRDREEKTFRATAEKCTRCTKSENVSTQSAQNEKFKDSLLPDQIDPHSIGDTLGTIGSKPSIKTLEQRSASRSLHIPL
jgi:hypothetical protein